MLEYILEYGLFLAEAVTVVISIAAIVLVIALAARRDSGGDHLEVTKLNDRYDAMARLLERETMDKKAFKTAAKQRKKEAKATAKSKAKDQSLADSKRCFVINFKGDIKASAVASLREEITAILTLVKPADAVLLRLENPGGLVHEHGLAASQLLRLRQRDIPLTVAVDKIAASGGYMMACVANRIVAAPFAVLGSIGVLAQIPNFHRLLDAHGVDFEHIKGGEFKRTMTVFGKNTDADRAKMQADVEDTHALFRDFVASNRDHLDMERVATGEHWYGQRALELNLCDELQTSDDYLLNLAADTDLYEIKYTIKTPLSRRLSLAIESSVDRLFGYWSQRRQESRYGA